jgi:hypothetical protein
MHSLQQQLDLKKVNWQINLNPALFVRRCFWVADCKYLSGTYSVGSLPGKKVSQGKYFRYLEPNHWLFLYQFIVCVRYKVRTGLWNNYPKYVLDLLEHPFNRRLEGKVLGPNKNLQAFRKWGSREKCYF